jgi:hypothetical protein
MPDMVEKDLITRRKLTVQVGSALHHNSPLLVCATAPW